MFDFPDAAGRAPDKQLCFSPEGADSPYETYYLQNYNHSCDVWGQLLRKWNQKLSILLK